MPLESIHNGRGFFSDYWLGSILASRKRGQGAKLTNAQLQKIMRRLAQLCQRVDTVEPPDLTTFREKFARPLLSDIFGFNLADTDEDTRLRLLFPVPDASEAGSNPAPATNPLAAIYLCPDPDELDARSTRNAIDHALLDEDLSYGFILTPAALRLVRKPGDGHKNAYFDFSIAGAAEGEDLESLQAAWRLLRAGCFVPDAGGHRPIDLLEAESRKHGARVSEDLKTAVFHAAERLIAGFLEDIRHRPDQFDPKPSLPELRDAALQTLYRLLFILYAESRDERLQGHPLYLKSYSLEGLIDSLLKSRHDSHAGNRSSIWSRLLVLFRIFDQGLPPLPGLRNIPPRGGTLFSETTPVGLFLARVRLSDRMAAGLILDLAVTRPRRGVGRERVSFRELAIEQLGSVYEGLLEYEPRIAEETMVEVKVQGREFVLTPPELVRLCGQKDLELHGSGFIVEGTAAAALHPDFSEDDDEDEEEMDEDEAADDEKPSGEEEEDKGIKKGATARLIRRLEPGDFYFVPGTARKSSGSYYTREEIVHYLVKNALGDLTAGKSPAEIEALRIIDPACGSAHFLVGAARWLGRELHEAYRREQGGDPPPDFHPGRDLTPAVREEWGREGETWCKRRVVERCLYGVDLNPMAVQLAQVALWIESLAGDRPLSFFDHHIRCGNSLLGTWLERFHEPPHPSLGGGTMQRALFALDLDREIAAALDERLLIDGALPAEVRKDTPDEYDYKADRLRRAAEKEAHARLLFDLRNASPFIPRIWAEWPNILQARELEAFCRRQPWWEDFTKIRSRERFLHWELEFPEVFRVEKKGFDAILGNPPWDKVLPDRKEFYGGADILIRAYTGGELDARIRELHAAEPSLEAAFGEYSDRVKLTAQCLRKGGDFKYADWIINEQQTGGHPDLFKFFVERGHRILREGGRLGFLVPSAIYNNEGCTGLRHLMLDESTVSAFYGFENRQKLFPIDSRYKFVCLVLEKLPPPPGGGRTEAFHLPLEGGGRVGVSKGEGQFPATFMRHDVEELESGPPPGVTVLIRKPELERLSHGTLAFLEYRSERDREIILKMYGLLPGMEPRPLLGGQGPDTWNARFYTEFNMTNDRDLWTKPDGKLFTPKEICGLDWPADESIPFAEVRAAMAREGFWPLYEGKHIEQFLTDLRPVERWVDVARAEQQSGHPPDPAPMLVFRDIARNTDERTCISAVLPERSCFGHTISGLEVKGDLAVWATLLNSFVFDYALRFRTGGMHLSFTFISKMPLLGFSGLNSVATRTASANGGTSSLTEIEAAYGDLWEANHAVAGAYGLTADEFEHILASFPVFARKRPAFLAYLHARLKEWKGERGDRMKTR